MQCELCGREINCLTVHHLIPRQETKRKKAVPGPTAMLCHACHKQIHSLFTNRQLASDLNSLEKLRDNPDMKRFLAWVSKQDPNRRIRVDRKRN
jgi:ATP-dependent protease Clp ATPase subunit